MDHHGHDSTVVPLIDLIRSLVIRTELTYYKIYINNYNNLVILYTIWGGKRGHPWPAGWSACTSGRRAGGNRTSGRAARHVTRPTRLTGLEQCGPGWAASCSGVAAVLGRHGGGCQGGASVQIVCASVPSGTAVVPASQWQALSEEWTTID